MNFRHLFFLMLIFLFSCEKKEPYYAEVRKILEKILEGDQKYRLPEYIPEKQNPIDKKNLKIVTKIIDSLGWLSEKQIGHEANLALFTVIQHTDNLAVMEKYLAKMKTAAKDGKADKKQLAYLMDRSCSITGRKFSERSQQEKKTGK